MQWARLMGMATMASRKTLLVTLMGRDEQFKTYLHQFFADSTDWLCLQVVQMPRCRDLAIFVVTMDDRQEKLIALPLVHACGVIIVARKPQYIKGTTRGLY